MAQNRFSLWMHIFAILFSIITLFCILFYWLLQKGWLFSCAISFGTTAYHFLMRLGVGHLVLKLTDNRFDYHARWFQPRPWETILYKKLRVKNWKKHLPTYSPRQFSMADNALSRIVQNMCGAEVVHEIIMVLSFLPLLAVPLWGAFPVFLITSLCSVLFDSIFVIAQRYNRPRLIRLLEKQATPISKQ